jgi:hypothetical protein
VPPRVLQPQARRQIDFAAQAGTPARPPREPD